MPTNVKVEHINPFITSTKSTFSTMLSTEVVTGKLYLKKGMALEHDLSAVIRLSGGAKGAVILGFQKIQALKIASTFAGQKLFALREDAADALGELGSIIAGSAKKDLSQYKINISLPEVILNGNPKCNSVINSVALVMPFECSLGSFDLTVSFVSND